VSGNDVLVASALSELLSSAGQFTSLSPFLVSFSHRCISTPSPSLSTSLFVSVAGSTFYRHHATVCGRQSRSSWPNVSELLGHRPVDVVHYSICSSPRWLEQLRHCRVNSLVPGGDTAITAVGRNPKPTVSIRRAGAFLIVKECAYQTTSQPLPGPPFVGRNSVGFEPNECGAWLVRVPSLPFAGPPANLSVVRRDASTLTPRSAKVFYG
jgi:hypothetical protein